MAIRTRHEVVCRIVWWWCLCLDLESGWKVRKSIQNLACSYLWWCISTQLDRATDRLNQRIWRMSADCSHQIFIGSQYTHVAETYNKGESELHTHCKENAQIMWSLFACTKVVDRDFYIHGPNLCLYVVAIFIRGVQFFACRNGCGFVRANSVCTESAAASSSSHSVSVGSFSGHHHDALGCAVRPTRHQCLSEWRRNGAGWERALFVFEQHKHTERIQRLANGVVPCHWCFFWSDRDNKTHTHKAQVVHNMDASNLHPVSGRMVVIENQISWRSCKKTDPKCMYFLQETIYVGLCFVCLFGVRLQLCCRLDRTHWFPCCSFRSMRSPDVFLSVGFLFDGKIFFSVYCFSCRMNFAIAPKKQDFRRVFCKFGTVRFLWVLTVYCCYV